MSKETIRKLDLFKKDEKFDSKYIAKGMDAVFKKEELIDEKPCDVLRKVLASDRMEPILGMIYYLQ